MISPQGKGLSSPSIFFPTWKYEIPTTKSFRSFYVLKISMVVEIVVVSVIWVLQFPRILKHRAIALFGSRLWCLWRGEPSTNCLIENLFQSNLGKRRAFQVLDRLDFLCHHVTLGVAHWLEPAFAEPAKFEFLGVFGKDSRNYVFFCARKGYTMEKFAKISELQQISVCFGFFARNIGNFKICSVTTKS